VDKPARIFARDVEWAQLTAFVSGPPGRPQLGVVSGRRRQGKTYLVEALAEQMDGLYFGAIQATETESLALFADAVGRHLDLAAPPRLASWDEAIRFLFSMEPSAGPVVIDEFPYLTKASPALPSILQREIDRAASRGHEIQILLSGSAMGGLLAGSAPLRGQATLDLVVRPFDYQLAAQFWQVSDPRLAVLLHSVVGGTPAYRRFVNDDVPRSVEEFDDWLLRTALSPASPLFREARYLLEEETEIRDTALYHSVLAAVAAGNNTRGGIANYIGRKATAIAHHLTVLLDTGLLRRDIDVFRSGRSTYRVAEPLVAFYQAVMRRQWGLLESGRATKIWEAARTRFSAQVVGPHFEQLCREFAVSAPVELFGGLPAEIGSGVVGDPARRSQIEVDVVVLAAAVPGEPRRVLSLGEANWGEVIEPRHIERLRRAKELLRARGYDTENTVLTCYSGAGFAADLASDVLSVGLPDLYAIQV
jgi:AAA+ ATPase superfamily predicted ATPase